MGILNVFKCGVWNKYFLVIIKWKVVVFIIYNVNYLKSDVMNFEFIFNFKLVGGCNVIVKNGYMVVVVLIMKVEILWI